MFPRISNAGDDNRPNSRGKKDSNLPRGLGGRTLGVRHPYQNQIRIKSMLLANTSNSMGFSRKKSQASLNPQLYSQFIYFRREFIETCTASQITIPLEMLEDSNERVFAFIQQKGPSHVLQVIRSASENINLLRSSCSLLIVTLTILQVKCETEGKIEKSNEEKNLKQYHSNKKSGSHSLAAWILEQLNEICDSSAIQILVQILKYCNKLSINELILSLIAKMVAVSKEAALQMIVSVPSDVKKPIPLTDGHEGDGGSSVVSKGSSVVNSLTNPSKGGNHNVSSGSVASAGHGSAASSAGGSKEEEDTRTCLSYVFSSYACNRNKEVIMAATADILIGILITLHHETDFDKICGDIARTTVTQLPLIKIEAIHKSTRKKVISQMSSSSVADASTASVPEVYVVVKGHPDTKLSVHIIDKEGREGIGYSKGDLTVAPSKPIGQKEVDRAIGGLKDTPFTLSQFKSDAFCDISEMESNLYISSAEIKHAKKVAVDDLIAKRKLPLKVPGEEIELEPKGDNVTQKNTMKGGLKDVEWAIMKLLLKFLQRFREYTVEETSESLAESAIKQANQPCTQHKTLEYAFKKVLNAVCLLIINSDEVAKFINTLTGVEKMIRRSGDSYPPNSNQRTLVNEACVFLKFARTIDRSGERQGTIMLHLISCNDLHTDDEDVSDPFVQITCGKSAMKSKRMNNNLNPEFNEIFRIPWDTHCPLVLEVMDYDGANETQPLGDVTIDIEALDFSDGNVIKFKNKKLQNIQTGSISFEVSYKPLPGNKAPDGVTERRSSISNKDSPNLPFGGNNWSDVEEGILETDLNRKASVNSFNLLSNTSALDIKEEDEEEDSLDDRCTDDGGPENMIEMPVLYSPERNVEGNLGFDRGNDRTEEVISDSNDEYGVDKIINNRPSFVMDNSVTISDPKITAKEEDLGEENSKNTQPFKPKMATKSIKSPYIDNNAEHNKERDKKKPRSAPKSPLKPISKSKSKLRPQTVVSESKTGMSLDRDFFHTLRSAPQLPRTLSANNVLHPDDDMTAYLSRSIDAQNTIMNKTMKTVQKRGGFHDGKHSRSIMDRATDVYLNAFPKENPKTPAKQVAIAKVNDVTEKGNDKISAEGIQTDGTSVERPFFVNEVTTDSINKFFLFPELFEFLPSEAEKDAAAAERAKETAERNETDTNIGDGSVDAKNTLSESFEAIDEAAELADALQRQTLEESAIKKEKNNAKSEIFVLEDEKEKLKQSDVGPDMDKEKILQTQFIMSQDFIYPN